MCVVTSFFLSLCLSLLCLVLSNEWNALRRKHAGYVVGGITAGVALFSVPCQFITFIHDIHSPHSFIPFYALALPRHRQRMETPAHPWQPLLHPCDVIEV